jgi:HK97 family phage major capsid protein
MENPTPEETKMLDAVKTVIAAEVKSLKESSLTKEQMEEAINLKHQELAKTVATPEALKALEDLVIAANLEIKALKESAPKGKAAIKSWTEQATEQGITNEKLQNAVKAKQNLTFDIARLEKKTVGDVAYPTNDYIPFPYMESGWGEAPITKPVMKPICDTRTSPTARATWVERGAREGTVGVTSPGTAKDQLDFTPTVATATASKYAAYIKAPDELLTDVDMFLQETQNDLVNTVLKAEDAAIITYAISKASAFDLTTLKTTTPTKYESIMAMATQVRTNNFEPTAIILNPIDFCTIEFDAFNNGYAVVGWINGGGPTIGGVPVYQSNQITAGYAMVGDMKKVHIREFGGLSVQLGLSGDDFINNIFTLRGETRTIVFVKGGEEDALCYDAISDVVTAITT